MNIIAVIFGYMNRFPLLGVLVCLLMVIFLNGPKGIEKAKLSGILPGAKLTEATIIGGDTRESRGRRGRKTTVCYIQATDQGQPIDLPVNCSDWQEYTIGDIVTLAQVGDTVEVADHSSSRFAFDFLLIILELFGVVYFGRKFLVKSSRE